MTETIHAGRARLGAIYLVVLAVGVFFLADLPFLGALVLLQLVLGAVVVEHPRVLLKPFKKLAIFAVLIIASYLWAGVGPDDQLFTVDGIPGTWSRTGLNYGIAMVLRIFAVVLASAWVRELSGAGGFVVGMAGLGMPRSLATLIDQSLRLIDASPDVKRSGGGGGAGGGGGGGRGKGRDPGLRLRGLLRGEGTPILVDLVVRYVARAAATAEPEESSERRDMTLLAGLLLMMLSIKAFKLVPGLPFAPGHKGVVLIPIYLLAASLTQRRFAGTLLGAAFGLVSFLFGDGRYGILEVFKHITPGLVADGFAPWLRRERSFFAYAAIGMILAVARWGTIALVVLLVGAPEAVIALLAPVALVHLVFGAASGAVTGALLKGAGRIREAAIGKVDLIDERDHGTQARGAAGSGGGRGDDSRGSNGARRGAGAHGDDMSTGINSPSHIKGLVTGDGRTHVDNKLMRESLQSHTLNDNLAAEHNDEVSLLPWAKFINIGGGSIMDNGREAILPLLDEVMGERKNHHFILSVGAGVRAKHTYEIAMGLGLPHGGLAQLVGAVEEQNSTMLHALLSQHGGISMCREHFGELPKYLLTGMTPIVISMPPYHFWEPPPREGRLPEHGSDLGAFMTAEVLGVNQMVFIKDRDGQFTRNPAKHSDATLMKECRVADLIELPADDLIVERSVLHALNRARHVRSIQIINGLERGNLKRALEGENAGTIISKDEV